MKNTYGLSAQLAKQEVEFRYTYNDKAISIKTEGVFLPDLIEDFKSFLLAIGHAPSNVDRIELVDKEEKEETCQED